MRPSRIVSLDRTLKRHFSGLPREEWRLKTISAKNLRSFSAQLSFWSNPRPTAAKAPWGLSGALRRAKGKPHRLSQGQRRGAAKSREVRGFDVRSALNLSQVGAVFGGCRQGLAPFPCCPGVSALRSPSGVAARQLGLTRRSSGPSASFAVCRPLNSVR